MTRKTLATAETFPHRVCVADLSQLLAEQATHSILPLVSVIIPTHNSANYLRDTFYSVLNQKYRPIEVLMVDDCSTDGTRKLIEELLAEHDAPEFRVRFLDNNKGGASAGRNIGVSFSTGDFIQFLDHDDILHPDKLRIQVSAAAKYGADLVVSRNRGFSSNDEIADILHSPPQVSSGLHVPNPFFSQMRWSHLAWLVRRDLLNRVGSWNENLRLSDYEMDVRLKLNAERICLVNSLLSFWRMSNPSSESKSPSEQVLSWRHDVAVSIFCLLRKHNIATRKEYEYLARYMMVTGWRFLRIGRLWRCMRSIHTASKIWLVGLGGKGRVSPHPSATSEFRQT